MIFQAGRRLVLWRANRRLGHAIRCCLEGRHEAKHNDLQTWLPRAKKASQSPVGRAFPVQSAALKES